MPLDLWILGLVALLCPTSARADGPRPSARTAEPSSAPNVLVVIADDFGAEMAACYEVADVDKAPQPNLAALCRRGVVFDRAWANPLSSPTRASMLTGQDAWRHGVGEATGEAGSGLSPDAVALPAVLRDLGYATGAFGKWHLADSVNGGVDHPNLAGFDRYAGSLHGQVERYTSWIRVEDGVESTSTTYATTATVDDALAWIGEQSGPWFAWVAFNAPHSPVHLPPLDLHSYDELPGDGASISANLDQYYLPMVEAMDTELGRLLDGLDPDARDDTWIIFMGDNGTWWQVNQDAYTDDHAKGSLYQGGVDVPLVMVGPGIDTPGRRVPFVVSATDLFATILELAGGAMEDLEAAGLELDSVSMKPYLDASRAPPQRDFVLAEQFGPRTPADIGGQAITDGRIKLIRFGNGTEEVYDLSADPGEAIDLATAGLDYRTYEKYVLLSAALDERPIDVWWTSSTYTGSGAGSDTGSDSAGE